jgi:acetyltransferase-like isoleucine patch superfamily enzyme
LLRQEVQGAEYCNMGQDVAFGKNSKVIGRHVSIGSGTTIGDDVTIMADVIHIGRRCRIEKGVESSWHGGNAKLFMMGDCCFLGWNSRILVREFCLGDYVVLHNHLLAHGDAELTLGNNAWMGQNGILNANVPLKIGNNVGIGAYSAVWTHGKFGALIDGCLMHKEAPVVIEEDACLWRAVVSPGVTVGRRAVVLPGSVVTKDVPADSCFGGVPAVDISSKVKTYRSVTMDEKFQMMKGFVAEFLAKHYPDRYLERGEGEYVVKAKEEFLVRVKPTAQDRDLKEGQCALVMAKKDGTTRSVPGVSVFELAGKTYTKWLTEPEVEFMWFLLDSRARFNPVEPK